MIRRATREDIPRIVALGRQFHAYSPWRDVDYDEGQTAEFIGRVVDGLGAVFLSPDGMCGGILTPLFFSPVLIGVEMFWWAPTNGRALREAFEDWALSSGARAVQFSALADDNIERVDRIYRRAGFKRAEDRKSVV